MITPLRAGRASLVIDTAGHAQIGAWGYGVPSPGTAVNSVRQNLGLLVSGSRPSSTASDWSAWGATLGGGEYVASSALGQTASGDIVYAGSMSAAPADLAAALVSAGVVAAMELDINPGWVQLDVAPDLAARSARRFPARTVQPASTWPAGPVTSSQFWAGWPPNATGPDASGDPRCRPGSQLVQSKYRGGINVSASLAWHPVAA